MKNPALDCLYGMAIGSSLGLSKDNISDTKKEIVTDLDFYKGEEQAIWSNDVSLAYCIADTLINGYDLQKIIDAFIDWSENTIWSVIEAEQSHTIDHTNYKAINALKKQQKHNYDSETDLSSGSMKYILPLIFYTWNKPSKVRFQIVKEVTELTHPDPIAIVANFYLLEFARYLILQHSPRIAYLTLQQTFPIQLRNLNISEDIIRLFDTLFTTQIWHHDINTFTPGPNPIDTLETVLWSLLVSNSFVDAVLTAVNIEGNSETLGTVTGGIAALFYGAENIPRNWLNKIALRDKIEQLASAIYNNYLQTRENSLSYELF